MARRENWEVNKLTCNSLTIGKVGTGNYGIVGVAKDIATAGGDTTEVLAPIGHGFTSTDQVITIYNTTDDTDTLVSSIVDAPDNVTTVLSADPSTGHGLTHMIVRAGGSGIYDVVYGGTFTTAGGDAAESITVTGALATDIAIVGVKTRGSTPRYVAAAIAAANAITVTMSGDPSTDHVLSYVVLRPKGSFTPSHYIFAAGNHTTVGGSATESFTVAGAQTTDLVFATLRVTNDTDYLASASVSAASTVSVIQSADPSTAHAYSYVVFRQYS